MAKLWLTIIAGILSVSPGWSQLSEGGMPLSFSFPQEATQSGIYAYTMPEAFPPGEDGDDFTRPYMIASGISTDISYPQSGASRYLQDGRSIWTAKVQVRGAKALGLYYGLFHLPEGVRFYLVSKNGKHILGAYTAANNNIYGSFASEALQGEEALLELDIPAGMAPGKIGLHITGIAAYHASVDYLSRYGDKKGKPTDTDPFGLEGSSSTCEINAICPEGAGYPIQRKATLQTLIPVRNSSGALIGLRSCSATMVNNTGNTVSDCKQYVLLATHCDGDNSLEDAHFSDWMFRFNFEKTTCTGGPPATVNTLTGASFRARANYIETETPEINGDFMLLELNDKIPLPWDVYLAGWNRSTSMPLTANLPQKFTGFHHPAGDVKKLMTIQTISPFGEAGGSLGPGTHWDLYPINEGGTEQGTSGSGLFDPEGRLIGIASVAGAAASSCNISGKGEEAKFFKYIAYSKLSLAWDYSLDGTGDNRKLKPWLDPLNSGVLTADPLRSNCTSPASGISGPAIASLDHLISTYPNPSRDGIVTIYVHTGAPVNITAELYDLAGKKLGTYYMKNAYKTPYTIDLGRYANGNYMLKFTGGNAIGTKKIILSR